MSFEAESLSIPDVLAITAARYADSRGYFWMTHRKSEFRALGIDEEFVQDNHSRSSKGVLRGLHYQNAPAAQGKLLTVLTGTIFDVAVDIRPGSPFYGKHADIILSEDKPVMLYIPPGFAHGFCVLSERADVLYKVTSEYSPANEAGIVWNDPAIGIQWPVDNPILSPKDRKLPVLRAAKVIF
ncbi:MAG TPA: dTDP-4-dehydrorhamnose 3,5-epimerase [Kiritimatiellia bacterium]|nr:dTDP-4-dehydrorhamnose 3,5-epimerase [Kiritimatiellia bacterium]HQQ03681.1 dTDP-4-dehydrorhamnose 3,5-epimerase [Kiritimatiellia bacterium]